MYFSISTKISFSETCPSLAMGQSADRLKRVGKIRFAIIYRFTNVFKRSNTRMRDRAAGGTTYPINNHITIVKVTSNHKQVIPEISFAKIFIGAVTSLGMSEVDTV